MEDMRLPKPSHWDADGIPKYIIFIWRHRPPAAHHCPAAPVLAISTLRHTCRGAAYFIHAQQ